MDNFSEKKKNPVNPFRTNKKSNNTKRRNESETHEEWGKKGKFNPDNSSYLQPATPWIELKKNILSQNTKVENNCKDEDESDIKNKRSIEEVMHSKRSETTTWEKFSPDRQIPFKKSFGKKNTSKKQHADNKLNTGLALPVIDKKGKFDKLTAAQSNLFRKCITKTNALSKSCSLKSAVNDLKYRGVAKKKIFHNTNL